MRIESSVTSVSWIPSEAVEGMFKLPFRLGLAHYDEPPPAFLDDINAWRQADLFREANELRAFIEVEAGHIVDYGHLGMGHIGLTRLKLGPKTASIPAVATPLLRPKPEVGAGWVRFVQTAGGRTGMAQDSALHAAIANAAHNRAIVRIVNALVDLLGQSREESLLTRGRPRRSHQDHRRILGAIRRRDENGARRAMLTHLTAVEGLVLGNASTAPAAERSRRPVNRKGRRR